MRVTLPLAEEVSRPITLNVGQEERQVPHLTHLSISERSSLSFFINGSQRYFMFCVSGFHRFREYLSGVQYALGVERCLYTFHCRDSRGGKLHLKVLLLGNANAVLAGYGPAQFQRQLEYIYNCRFGVLSLFDGFLVVHDIDMDIAVTGVTEARDEDAPFSRYSAEPFDELGYLRARHPDVFVYLVRLYPVERGRDRPPGLPEVFCLVLAFGGPEFGSAVFLADSLYRAAVPLKAFFGAVDLDK